MDQPLFTEEQAAQKRWNRPHQIQCRMKSCEGRDWSRHSVDLLMTVEFLAVLVDIPPKWFKIPNPLEFPSLLYPSPLSQMNLSENWAPENPVHAFDLSVGLSKHRAHPLTWHSHDRVVHQSLKNMLDIPTNHPMVKAQWNHQASTPGILAMLGPTLKKYTWHQRPYNWNATIGATCHIFQVYIYIYIRPKIQGISWKFPLITLLVLSREWGMGWLFTIAITDHSPIPY